MKCGTRSLAVLGALALSAMGLVPGAWAADVGQSGAVEARQSGAAQVEQSGDSDTLQSAAALAQSGAAQTEGTQAQSGAAQPEEPTQPAQSSAPETSAQSGDVSPGLVDTPIPDIQAVGAGDDSALVGATVTTLGVVTAAYPAAESGLDATLDGYTIQTPGSGGAWDEGRASSDALFVYAGKNGQVPAVGTCVRVTGKVGEFPRRPRRETRRASPSWRRPP